MIYNQHLEGGPFFWEAGPLGVLLIHGLTATAAEVRPLAERLHQAGYTVAGPLLAGHYTHPRDLNHVKWQDWVAQAEKSLLHLEQSCPVVFAGGESTGAVLALYLALHHPEIRALLLYAPALRLTMSRLDAIRLRILAPFVPWIPKANMDDNPLWQGYPVNPLKGVLQLLALQRQVLPRLEQICQPALVVQGRLDHTVHPSVPDELASRLGSKPIEKYWMTNSAHCVILDKELDQVTDLTLNFLRRFHAQQPAASLV